MLQEPDSLCSISILLSGIKYIIFLKTAFPRFVTKSYMHAHLLTCVHILPSPRVSPHIEVIQADQGTWHQCLPFYYIINEIYIKECLLINIH